MQGAQWELLNFLVCYWQEMKSKLLQQVHTEFSDLFDKALEEAAHSFPQQLTNGPEERQSR